MDHADREAKIEEIASKVTFFRCKRMIKELIKTNILLIEQEKGIGRFLEIFTQGNSLEEQYFYRMLIRTSTGQVVIVNNCDFKQHILRDFLKKMKVINISKKSCCPNKIDVKYFDLKPEFSEDLILGYKFDRMLDPNCPFSFLKMKPNLYWTFREAQILSYGHLNREVLKRRIIIHNYD